MYQFKTLIINKLNKKLRFKNTKNPILDQEHVIFFSFDISVTLIQLKMATMNFKLEDFEVEKLTKNQQKKVRGGDEVTTSSAPVDPGKKDTNGNV